MRPLYNTTRPQPLEPALVQATRTWRERSRGAPTRRRARVMRGLRVLACLAFFGTCAGIGSSSKGDLGLAQWQVHVTTNGVTSVMYLGRRRVDGVEV